MFKSKRVLSILLVLCVLTVLTAGCGFTGASSKEETSKSGVKQFTIGFSNSSISNSWRVVMRDKLVAACKEKGIKLIETDANDDANKQISDIESLLQKHLDAILITPVTEDAVNPGIEAAFDSGIPTIIFDRLCSTKKYTAFVSYSDVECGKIAAEELVKGLIAKNGSAKGNVIALDSMAGTSTNRLQTEGMDSVFKQYPDIKIIARQFTDFQKSKAKSFMEDCLVKYKSGEIDAFISQQGDCTLGAYEAIDEANRKGDGIICTNTDGQNGVCRLIKEGRCVGLTEFPCSVSVDALNVAIQCLEGKKPDKQEVFMPVVKVTKENVDKYYDPNGKDEDWTM
jgi:ABC-type sugar transport system, periplasmic component